MLRKFLAEPVAVRANTGSFDCGFAPHSRSKILAQDDRGRDRPQCVKSASEQVPGFLELGVAGVLAGGGEPDVEGLMKSGDGEDVPGVGGDDVGGDKVDLVGGVWALAVADGADVGVQALFAGAFYLHAGEVSVVFDGEVVGGVFSPGLGGAESEFDGAGEETEFGPLSARLGGADAEAGAFHD
jgi:hypothetical protein